jgi:hypothetical protein
MFLSTAKDNKILNFSLDVKGQKLKSPFGGQETGMSEDAKKENIAKEGGISQYSEITHRNGPSAVTSTSLKEIIPLDEAGHVKISFTSGERDNKGHKKSNSFSCYVKIGDLVK